MLFPTVDFAVFFVVVLAASWLLRPRPRTWRVFLLGASAVFYLDPFNPVHSGGAAFVTVNPAVLTATAAVVVLARQLLRVAFPPARRPAVAGAAVSGSAAPAGAPATEPTPASPARLPVTDPVVLWGAPLAVTVLVALANGWAAGSHGGRADQNARWLLLLISVALVNHAFAAAVHAARPAGSATPLSRALVAVAVAVDLGVLGWFKYANWFSQMWVDLAARAGVRLDALPAVVLPIAISFFTFQAISYVVDVGRGRQAPVPLLDFMVYLTFFAHLVAGPIVRVREFVPQLNRRVDPRVVPAGEAFELIFRGLFKKVVVSSYVATQIVQPVLDAPAGFTRVEVLAGIAGYAVQIYADFSGYTDIAIGVALLLGVRFPQNFDAPYRAVSLQDFWHRWHMTLSRWLRDYLYIPLGGSRAGPTRTQVNIVATMLLGGLWHGADATFVVWGAIHGFGLVAERRVKQAWARRPGGPLGVPRPVVRGLQWAGTMALVCLAWVFFYARDLTAAFAVLGQLIAGEATAGATSRVTPVLVGVLAASLASQFVPPDVPRRIFDRLTAMPPIVQAAAGAGGLLLIVVLGPEGVAPFIYFQF